MKRGVSSREACRIVGINYRTGPVPGEFTGLKLFEQVLARHPRLVAVLAHAGMPEFDEALRLAASYENVFLDTTMVGTPFSQQMSPLPADWSARLAVWVPKMSGGWSELDVFVDGASESVDADDLGVGWGGLRFGVIARSHLA